MENTITFFLEGGKPIFESEVFQTIMAGERLQPVRLVKEKQTLQLYPITYLAYASAHEKVLATMLRAVDAETIHKVMYSAPFNVLPNKKGTLLFKTISKAYGIGLKSIGVKRLIDYDLPEGVTQLRMEVELRDSPFYDKLREEGYKRMLRYLLKPRRSITQELSSFFESGTLPMPTDLQKEVRDIHVNTVQRIFSKASQATVMWFVPIGTAVDVLEELTQKKGWTIQTIQ